MSGAHWRRVLQAADTVGAIGAVGAEMGRRLWRYAWPSPAVRSNRAYLRDRLIALPLLSVIAFGAFGWAYADVRGDSAYLRDHIAPALVDLADARVSLQIAQGEAGRDLLDEDGAVELSGLSERYRTRMSRATQSLSQVGQHGALTVSEQQNLSVISGLLLGYSDWINQAQADGDRTLRKAELTYAQSMLCDTGRADATGPGYDAGDGTGGDAGDSTGDDTPYPECRRSTGSAATATTIVDRISALEQRLRGRLEARAAWGGGVLAALAVSAVAFVLLAVGLVRTVVFLRHRFRIRLSLPLVVAALPLAAVPLLAADAVLAYDAQQQVVPSADVLSDRTSPDTEVRAEDQWGGRPDPLAIGALESSVNGELAAGRLSFLDGVAPFVMPVGVVGAAVIGGALHTYRREYLLLARPGAAS
ncbi:hypothetical protein [Streptomyces jeddahensis]|uniref:Uncharacterized protein n=1 Tax=Streptomyces jeddahensis TaxID=1716141 RepID=A0A177HWG2_9ACTN|nr:hypothetical protein [Streptomyces jeddahensis]OAH15205.1 hypothetical protein STSP_14240 [Streptomyces jeddahensis]